MFCGSVVLAIAPCNGPSALYKRYKLALLQTDMPFGMRGKLCQAYSDVVADTTTPDVFKSKRVTF